ncbi:MAG TPA: condensation domain-containing protein, partial [Candidatus Elarobacter sp.]|nr:condensation domain-containing protein [Candidatus Elarobacter sp.]
AVRMLSRVRETLRSELRLDDVFEAPVLADLAALVRPAQRSALPAITPVDRDRPLVASFAQQRMWLSAQIEGVSETYHVPLGWRLSGRLDRAALRRALDRLVARHESLRTAFDVVNGEPVQRIDPAERGFGLLEHDLRGRPGAAAELEELVAREASEAFDLQAGPLVRGRLIALSSDEHVLLITMHHILSDGWSVGVLVRELSALYRAYHDGADDPLVPLPVQYADFAAWQRRSLAGETSLEQSAYWRQTLSGAPALLELPTDRPRPVHQNFAGDHVPVELSASLTAQLRAFSLRHGTTLFMTLLAAWGMLLSRLSGQEDVIVGVPVANRTRTEVEGLIGFFVNTLALRLDFSGDPTVGEVLARVKSRTLQAQAHQDLPFEQVVELVNPDRAAAHTPLFQVTFVWQNGGGGDDRLLAGVRSAPVYTASRFSKFDLTLELGEANDRITGGLLYATALFDRATMTRHAGYLRTLLEGMVAE